MWYEWTRSWSTGLREVSTRDQGIKMHRLLLVSRIRWRCLNKCKPSRKLWLTLTVDQVRYLALIQRSLLVWLRMLVCKIYDSSSGHGKEKETLANMPEVFVVFVAWIVCRILLVVLVVASIRICCVKVVRF